MEAGGGNAIFVPECDHKKGVFGPARRQGFELLMAQKRFEVGGWIEPEKYDLLQFVPKLVKPILEKQADHVTPERSGVSWRSYPEFQEACERVGNLAWQRITRQRLDVWQGPRFFNKKALQYYLDYADEYGGQWDCIFIPPMRMIADGLVMDSVSVECHNSAEQYVLEETNPELGYDKRVRQLHLLVEAIRKEGQKLGMLTSGQHEVV